MNLYHYCSNATLLSILSTQEIWASEFSLANDRMEGKWIREVFSQYCSDKGVLSADQDRLLNHLDFVIASAGGAGFCMSEEGDLLSQWRAYSDGSAGVSIGFSKQYFEELGSLRRDRNDDFSASLARVEYDVGKQKLLIAEHLDEILKFVAQGALRRPNLLTPDNEAKEWRDRFVSMGLRFIFFFFYIYHLKNPAFSEEREWRIISYLVRHPHHGKFDQIAKMDFRALPDRVVPFTRIKLEQLSCPSIVEIVLGPRNITPIEVISGLLEKYGWSNVNVRKSSASYR